MQACINDLSFKGQFRTIDEVISTLKDISSAATAYQIISEHKPVRRTRCLVNRPLIGTASISDISNQLLASKNPKDRSILTLILSTLIQGPFIKENEFDEKHNKTKSICGEDVKHTALHVYLSKNHEGSVHAVISAKGTNSYNCDKFDITSATSKMTTINLLTSNCYNAYRRIYEANPKHDIRADKLVEGKVHTKMDLNAEDAQYHLNNGFQIIGSNYVYAFANGQWYEFPAHRECRYHGYPIGTPNNNPEINRIIKVFGDPPYGNNGYNYCVRP